MSDASMITKLSLVNSALSKITISGITAPATSDDYQTLLFRLEGLMHEIEGSRNICTRYNFTTEPDTGDPHGMDFGLFEPISNILAVRVLQDYEIPPGTALTLAAAAAVSSLSAQTFQIRETQYPRRQGRGSGNTLRYNRWQRFYRKPDRVPLVCSTIFLSTDEINDFNQSWRDYLQPGETILRFVLTVSGGLRVVRSSNTDTDINYRLQALTPSVDTGVEQVRISMQTNTGRVDERIIAVEVMQDGVITPAFPDVNMQNSFGFGPFGANFNNSNFGSSDDG